RSDGVSWSSAGFVLGQQITVGGVSVGTVSAISGAALTVTGTVTQGALTDATVAVRDPKTGTTRIGGDTITITGGAGPGPDANGVGNSAYLGSPLVVYGDTSQDGI